MTLWVTDVTLWTAPQHPWTTKEVPPTTAFAGGRSASCRWTATAPSTWAKAGLSTIHITYYCSSKNYIPL